MVANLVVDVPLTQDCRNHLLTLLYESRHQCPPERFLAASGAALALAESGAKIAGTQERLALAG